MRTFNSFQLVTLFAAFPYVIQWLDRAEFRGAGAFFWVAIAAFVIMYLWIISVVADSLKN